MDSIKEYILDEKLSDDRGEDKKVNNKSSHYSIIEETWY